VKRIAIGDVKRQKIVFPQQMNIVSNTVFLQRFASIDSLYCNFIASGYVVPESPSVQQRIKE
jgi:hypothetical protein